MKTFLKLFGLAALCLVCSASAAEKKKIILVAGKQSHGAGDHEFRAGSLLLEKCLDQVSGIEAIVVSNGWPADVSIFNDAAAIMFFADGGGGHPAIQGDRLKTLEPLMKHGVGIATIHYGVEVPKDKGGPEFLAWVGGYFETYYSVNPHWDAEFTTFPKHAITRGVKPFKIRDEWYYHMRFPEGMKGVTPILTATPPESTRGKPGANEAHGGNPHVQANKGNPEHLAWAFERTDGGRGFGFTGAHHHKNWGNEDFRKLVLNALLWVAKVDVPEKGAECALTPDDLTANLDPKTKK